MLIIFEGPKGTGKSTAIEATKKLLLERGFQVEIAKFDRGEDPTADMANFINNLYLNGRPTKEDNGGSFNKVVTLVDRFHITEFVYRTFDGKHSRSEATTLGDTIYIQRLLMAARASVVILHCDDADRIERIKKRLGDESRTRVDDREVVEFYEKTALAMKEKYHNVSYMNTSELDPEAVARIIGTFVNYVSEQTLRLFK
jgi:thymidylate kinase